MAGGQNGGAGTGRSLLMCNRWDGRYNRRRSMGMDFVPESEPGVQV
jgi:hypothetical protein